MEPDDDSSSSSCSSERRDEHGPSLEIVFPSCSTPKKDSSRHGNIPSLVFENESSVEESECSPAKVRKIVPSVSGNEENSLITSNLSFSDASSFNDSVGQASIDETSLKKPLHTYTRAGLWKRQQRLSKGKVKATEILSDDESTSVSEIPDMSNKSFNESETSIALSFSGSTCVQNLNSNISFDSYSASKEEPILENLDINDTLFNSTFPEAPANHHSDPNVEGVASVEENSNNYSVNSYESESDDSGDEFDANVFECSDNGPLHSDSDNTDDDTESEMDDEEFFSYCESLKADGPAVNDELSELHEFLRSWALKHGITHVALSDLCKGLKDTHPECFTQLKKDARSILHTPKEPLKLIKVDPGEYIHVGLRKQLNFAFSLLTTVVTCLSLLFNIDGVQLYKNTTHSLWTILMMVPCIPSLANKVFVIGLYYGKTKPEDVKAFLQPFIDELLDIIANNNFSINGVPVKIDIFGFCCDTPARSYILSTVSHTGYFSCFRCTSRGRTVAHRRVFPKLNSRPREDTKFRAKLYRKFQVGETPLLQLPGLNFTRSFILDPMHLVYIGVVKGLITLWVKGKRPHRLSPALRRELQVRLERCFYFIPSEFSRRPRDLKNISIWKATEVRLFLLYLGPVILRRILGRNQYLHFLELAIAMRIYHSAVLCANVENRNYAKSLLFHFVENIKLLYGVKFVSHNCHTLNHLWEDVEYFIGSIEDFTIDCISAWPFENFNQFFSKYTRGRAKALQQLGRRLAELFSSEYWQAKYYAKNKSLNGELLDKHSDGPVPLLCKGVQYKTAQFPAFKLSVDKLGDCVCGTKTGDVIIAMNFIHDRKNGVKYVVGKRFEQKSNFFMEPMPDSQLYGISSVSNPSKTVRTWPLSEIVVKYVRVPLNEEEYVVLPLLHSDLTPSNF
ncbi:uncharacterized protein [Bemisia tabaci]|uniref:uncharacterized protein isoform X1 n=1 Tax=Bemisia tabaci TaxID=7038 RepID=UPI003B27C8F9